MTYKGLELVVIIPTFHLYWFVPVVYRAIIALSVPDAPASKLPLMITVSE
jgi:hypothetical protein